MTHYSLPRTAADLQGLPWLEVRNPDAILGRIRHALFDFDGTISVVRQGWEQVMIPLMIEMICDGHPPPPGLAEEVASYVDRSTGILTIKQMQWLEEAVRRYGLARHPLTARQYKTIYNERLLEPVRQRLAMLDRAGADARAALAIVGAHEFLAELRARGVQLYLVSGTDHIYVLEEAAALGITDFFAGEIYGALDDTEAYTKGRIIARILDEHNLHGEELLVVGDGPVEIREAVQRGALALGVASDEVRRHGLNPRKRERLIRAGADLIVADFEHHDALAAFLTGR